MNIDPELLSRLSGMDQKELSHKIAQACAIMGMDAQKIRDVIGSPDDVQKMLKGLNESDLKKISEKIDPALLKKLNSGDR